MAMRSLLRSAGIANRETGECLLLVLQKFPLPSDERRDSIPGISLDTDLPA